MKRIKAAFMYVFLTFVSLMCRGEGFSFELAASGTNEIDVPIEMSETDPFAVSADCFEYAESVTGFSAEILRGIAATESRFHADAIGDGGMSLGMFQLHSRWHEFRADKWGEFDPADPFDSAVIAARIMRENLEAFSGDLRSAIAAYRQGAAGVRENGVICWYVDAVLGWREDSEKEQSFFLFCGIKDTEGL
jgi:hypothetical protein